MADAIIIILLLAIIAALGAGGFFMLKDGDKERRAVIALTIRIGLSVALILFLIAAFLMGWIHPHGVAPH